MILPRALLLDLDDTILDDSGCVDECWAEAATRGSSLVPGLTAIALQEAIRECGSWWWSDAERNRRGRLDLRAATTVVVGESLHRLGFQDTAAAGVIANHYRDLREEKARLHDGALETLEWARSQGIMLGLMTNGAGPAQRIKIERFGLERFFGHIVIEGECGYGKPDLRVYETLLGGSRGQTKRRLGCWRQPGGRRSRRHAGRDSRCVGGPSRKRHRRRWTETGSRHP